MLDDEANNNPSDQLGNQGASTTALPDQESTLPTADGGKSNTYTAVVPSSTRPQGANSISSTGTPMTSLDLTSSHAMTWACPP